MSDPRTPRETLLDVAAGLRWTLKDLRLGGLREIPKFERPVMPRESASAVPESGPEDGRVETPSHAPQAGLVPVDPLLDEVESEGESLADIREDLGDCRRCRLHRERKHLVFADGSSSARLVFVGEGPGFDEDQQGLPFVGRAGRLLDKMIASLGFHRRDVYICNVVKCRPPKNRTPDPEEISACSPFLFRQIESIQPDVVCALGACAAQTLLNTGNAISKLRGKVHLWRGIRLVCTYHPAYLLRNPASKAAAWQDLLEIRRILDVSRRD